MHTLQPVRVHLRLLPVLSVLAIGALLLSACQSQATSLTGVSALAGAEPTAQVEAPVALPSATPFPARPRYSPGELVDYTAQTGDSLPALAIRFNTTEDEILQANPFIPPGATTMPPGMPMKIPIYYLPFWGPSYQILPDSLFVNGPAQIGFDTTAFVEAHPGWLKSYRSYVYAANQTGAQIVDLVAQEYSVSPRLLLALLEYQGGALSQPTLTPERQDYPLGYPSWEHKGVYNQLSWGANLLNNGYYGWRLANLTQLTFDDGRIERFDPWQNAATVGLHIFFNTFLDYESYRRATGPDGFARAYQELFGDPWANDLPHIPGSLVQPEFILPFEIGDTWAFTGGPHTGWGDGEPLAAIDFAPPLVAGGCQETDRWAVAVAPGIVVRSGSGEVMLDTDGDGDERTGWDVYYLHIAGDGRAPLGAQLQRGDLIGHPSCEGGRSTGTHVHFARKYNGEWMLADGVLAFNLEGWISHYGAAIYQGYLTRNNQVITANSNANGASFIASDRR